MRLCWPLLLAFGCNEYGIKAREDGEGGSGPDVAVDPTSVNFGTVEIGGTSVDKVVTVSNEGRGDLHLDPLSLDAIDGTFTVTALDPALEGGLLETDDRAQFVVSYTPIFEGEATGTVWVLSDDPDEPAVPVYLVGDSPDLPHPDALLAPGTYDFGVLDPFSSASVELVLTNEGDADLTVSGYAYSPSSPELSLQDPEAAWGPPPWVLAAGESRSFTVDYVPTDGEPDSGTFTIYSDDPDEPQLDAVQVADAIDPSEFQTR